MAAKEIKFSTAARDKMLAVVEKFDLPTADSLLAPLVEARTAVQALAAKAKEKVRHAAHITPPAHATIDLCVPLRCSAALLPPCAALLHCCHKRRKVQRLGLKGTNNFPLHSCHSIDMSVKANCTAQEAQSNHARSRFLQRCVAGLVRPRVGYWDRGHSRATGAQ